MKEKLELILAIQKELPLEEVNKLFEEYNYVFSPSNFKGKAQITENEILDYGRMYKMYLTYLKKKEVKNDRKEMQT